MQSKVHFRFRLLLVIALLACSTTAIVTLRSSPSVRAASLPTGLHVVGNKIEDGNGNVFIPRGVDRMGTEYACRAANDPSDFDGPVDQTAVSAMLSWGINAVRVPLNEDCWLGINGEPANGKTAAQYQSDIVSWVNLLNQNGLVVILDLHWNDSGTNQSLGQQIMPDLDHAPAFWTSVANTFKSNSSVIFDLYNEPHPNSWSCWENGSTAASASPCAEVPFAVAGMQTLINTVRATGATNILMLGGLAWANDMTGWLANEPTDPMNNLAASTHIYNFNACASTSCWDSQIAPVIAKVPVVAGEIGENDCAHGFIDGLMSWFDSQNTGYLAWTWTVVSGGCGSTPSLINDYSGTPDAYGVGLQAHLQSLAGGGGTTPTPTPPPTATPTPPSGSSSCTVAYSVTNQWQGGFGGSITITNTGSTTLNGWTLAFTFPDSQQITQGWNGIFAQSGANVTVTNESFNGTLAPGASVNPGFNGSWNSSNPNPAAFTLNGAQCS